jgi:hypothetical protein
MDPKLAKEILYFSNNSLNKKRHKADAHSMKKL